MTLKGKGVGGRNQEMLLAFLISLARRRNDPLPIAGYQFSVVSCAFDGIEGNSPATGAIVDSTSVERALAQFSLPELESYLENNDSHKVFASLGDALITGQTGTNVNDMVLILIEKNIA